MPPFNAQLYVIQIPLNSDHAIDLLVKFLHILTCFLLINTTLLDWKILTAVRVHNFDLLVISNLSTAG